MVDHAPEFLSQEDCKVAFHPKHLQKGGWLVHGCELDCSMLTALLFGFKHADTPEEKEYLFWEIANDVWNQDPDPENWMMAKHKWSWRMIHAACREKYLALGGAASSGKSHVMAGWAWVNWMADPANTMVLLTSTDLKGARGRVWGSVMKLAKYIPDPPCKFRDAIGVIAYYDGEKAYDTAGLKLIAADKSKSKDKVGKMIGTKAKKVILLADELGDISENVQTAATGNLASNPSFQMVGMSNPASRFDPFGVFCEPHNGWESVNLITDSEWRTKLNGLYLRFDSEGSPNIDTEPGDNYDGGVFYNYLPTQDRIDEALDALGTTREEARKSRNYMRFYSAVFYDSDDDETVYSESEFTRSGATARVKLTRSELLAGLDPSFSSGGDKTVLTFLECGWDDYGQFCVQWKETVYLYEDVTNKIDPRSLQIADKVKNECVKRGLKPENLAVDATGAGAGFCDFLQLQWKPGFLRVQFAGAASDKKIKNDSKLTGKDRYRNRASELFFIGKQFLLGRQFYGIPAIIAKQMCERISLDPLKGPKGLILQVESKKDFRSRKGYSPDETDSFLVGVELARTRFGLIPSDPIATRKDGDTIAKWHESRRTMRGLDPANLGHVSQLQG